MLAAAYRGDLRCLRAHPEASSPLQRRSLLARRLVVTAPVSPSGRPRSVSRSPSGLGTDRHPAHPSRFALARRQRATVSVKRGSASADPSASCQGGASGRGAGRVTMSVRMRAPEPTGSTEGAPIGAVRAKTALRARKWLFRYLVARGNTPSGRPAVSKDSGNGRRKTRLGCSSPSNRPCAAGAR